jgi:hypothetical protein
MSATEAQNGAAAPEVVAEQAVAQQEVEAAAPEAAEELQTSASSRSIRVPFPGAGRIFRTLHKLTFV